MNPNGSMIVNLALMCDPSLFSSLETKKEQASACLNLINCGVIVKQLLGDNWTQILNLLHAERFASDNVSSKFHLRLYISQSKCPLIYNEIKSNDDVKGILNDFFLLGLTAKNRGVSNFVSNCKLDVFNVGKSNELDELERKDESETISKDFLSMLGSSDLVN
ncbi:hypothetical protein ACRZ5S_23040 (plasmid) [Vibrio scophthalmi]|uniref:hypothetical protein n=1 Tax=Vibrio scophthalmi TaxID=45658 RepID=UPI003EBA460D